MQDALSQLTVQGPSWQSTLPSQEPPAHTTLQLPSPHLISSLQLPPLQVTAQLCDFSHLTLPSQLLSLHFTLQTVSPQSTSLPHEPLPLQFTRHWSVPHSILSPQELAPAQSMVQLAALLQSILLGQEPSPEQVTLQVPPAGHLQPFEQSRAMQVSVCWQPVALLQLSAVHGSPSSQSTTAPLQVPPPQTSLAVQASPSLQEAVLLLVTQPVDTLQLSVVQTSLSSQFLAAPAVQVPALQASPSVQALPSSHEAVLCTF